MTTPKIYVPDMLLDGDLSKVDAEMRQRVLARRHEAEMIERYAPLVGKPQPAKVRGISIE